MDPVPCAVLAGEKRLADGTHIPSRALEHIGGRPMADWSLDGLVAAEMVSDIYVVGLGKEALGRDDVRFVDVGGSFIENLERGLDACTGDRVLVATADIPFLSAGSVNDFVRRAIESGKEFCYSAVPVALTRARYPELKRTSVRLQDGELTGGNLVLISKQVVKRNADLISRIFDKRKNPVALARILGFGFVFRLLFTPRRITVEGLVRHAESIIDGTIAVIISEYPEIATDIDKPEDLEKARRMFEDDARGAA